MNLEFERIEKSLNIAEELDNEDLNAIASRVIHGFDIDEDSRSEWQERVDKAMEIAKQTMTTKNHPFPNASNVKYPLITQASIDFASRTYPEFIQNGIVVRPLVIGSDPEGEKLQRGLRVSRHMSYQLLHDSPEWETALDKLLHILPILGTVFKKTYYNPINKKPVSELCNPDKIVVNYGTKSLDECRRVTHILSFFANDIVERIRMGLYRDVDVDKLKAAEGYEDEFHDVPLELLEQHCFLDLDGDGYEEPYVVTVHKATGEVLRIVQRFREVKKNDKKEIIRIVPEQYFIDFHFIRSPDGGFYSMGLGTLLYPLNEAINTLINQLIDAGTLNNTQGGFLGRGLRLKNGELRLGLGEWKVLDAAAGSNLAQNIVPLPTKEPSGTLFQLLGLLIDVGKEMVANNDVMRGAGQTQNVAATTVLAMVEQGMKIFNAIAKRLYRSMRSEFVRIYELNKKYLSNSEYLRVIDDPNANVKADYNVKDLDIVPVANPSMATDAQRLARAQAILSVPTVDPMAASRYYLEALQLDQTEIEKLLPEPDPNAPPPPELLKTMAEVSKIEAEAKATLLEAEILSENQLLNTAKLNIQRDEALVRAEESAARIMKMKQDAMHGQAKVELAGAKADHQAVMDELDHRHQLEKDTVELSIEASKLNKDPKSE